MMHNHSIVSSQQKLAEKLTILNDRGIGMLTRISNIKKACVDKDPASKPAFLLEKNLEPTFKQIVKKFPNFEKGTMSQYSNLNSWKNDILKSLSLYYNTFVDLLDFKDQVNDLLTTIDACQIHFDIAINFDLSKNYLDLITTYVSLIILLSKVDDRKTVLGLYTIAHEMLNGQGDPSFPRLGQMIIDYEIPMKKLAEDFVPHSKLIYECLQSLVPIYKQKNVTAEEMRRNLMLNLSACPNLMLQPPFTDTINCDILSFEIIERWIILCTPLCIGYMQHQNCLEMFRNVLLNSHVHTLYRDDTILTHDFLLKFLELVKNSSAKKLIEIVKDTQLASFQNARYTHREKRQFLRSALREMSLLFTDQPGLLGPKALYLLIGLSIARDEVHWLLRHQYLHWFDTNKPAKLTKGMAKEDWMDKSLPELLFLIEELRTLARKYVQVIQRYYVEYLSSGDACVLNQHLEQILNVLPEDEAILLSSFHSTISSLSVKQIENNESINLRPLRLDWFRFQAYTSVVKLPFCLNKNTTLAKTMNTISFHSKMVDFIDEILFETSDLSLFCFYPNLFFENFHICFEYPSQLRYSIGFPLLCSHFMSCTHELCPEERQFIGRKSIDFASKVIDDMARETKDIIAQICDKHCELNLQLDPMQSLPFLLDHIKKKYRKDTGKKQNQQQQQSLVKPGNESIRFNREEMNFLDKMNMALAEWCYALNYTHSIQIWEFTFYPKEYLYTKLESLFNKVMVQKCFVEVTEKNEKFRVYLRPSEMLNIIDSYKKILLTIENHVQIDITKAFNNVLSQQSQLIDSNGNATLTRHYCDLYIEKLLRNIERNHVIYLPSQKCFLSAGKVDHTQVEQIQHENYINYNELIALCEIIGVVGAKYMIEQVNTLIYENLIKLKAIVSQNKEVLQSLRINFDRPDMMKELYKRLENIDLALVSLLNIGIYLAFKDMLTDCLNEILEKRLPYLMLSAEEFSKNFSDPKFELLVNEMSSSCGFKTNIDTGLYQIIKAPNSKTSPDDEYAISCLMMVLLAVSISRLTKYDSSQYKAELQAHANNSHCIALAINTLAGCLFYDMGADIQRNVQSRLTEFLALASSALLKLSLDVEVNNGAAGQNGVLSQKEQLNRDSVYIILDQIVQSSPFLSYDLLESCFPYALLRTSYRQILKKNSNGISSGVSNLTNLLISD
ncbi:unnamed protein product [Brachionus calyciflorus]|uniref:Membrane-associated protein Hem n=1 Tax=Brachionus calyciflorus TaxID=104777 RepID=A0A814H6F7_9BILA|nr:unnamed protein product [Brachionus calyciflorus]